MSVGVLDNLTPWIYLTTHLRPWLGGITLAIRPLKCVWQPQQSPLVPSWTLYLPNLHGNSSSKSVPHKLMWDVFAHSFFQMARVSHLVGCTPGTWVGRYKVHDHWHITLSDECLTPLDIEKCHITLTRPSGPCSKHSTTPSVSCEIMAFMAPT